MADKVIHVESDAKDKAIKLSQKYKMSMKAVVSTIIDICDNYNLLEPGWQERLNAAAEAGEKQIDKNRYMGLDDTCPALGYVGEKWKCIWGRDQNTPIIKFLAEDLDDALTACARCNRTRDIKNQIDKLQKEVTDLRAEKRAAVIKVPVCEYGAVLGDEGKTFSGCQRRKGQKVSIAGYCKVYRNGLPCQMYREKAIAAYEDL